jgi:hypothetical protein
MVKVDGVYGISATILADSVAPSSKRLTTFEVEFPRIVLAEMNTHRQLSRNYASSRAIPFQKMISQLTARPVRFGEANAGMQDKGVDSNVVIHSGNGQYISPEIAWESAKKDAVTWMERFYESGYHKQVYNRLTEPFQMIKGVISSTEYDNFFWLRCDEAADPTIAEIAKCMKIAYDSSKPQELSYGEYHLPYIACKRSSAGELLYLVEGDNGNEQEVATADAIKVSAARCAAVSYRNVDYTLDKSKQVYDRLVGSEKKHSSALEHQATPMPFTECRSFEQGSKLFWPSGVSHMDSDGELWSGNFKGWIQHRKTLTGECYTDA